MSERLIDSTPEERQKLREVAEASREYPSSQVLLRLINDIEAQESCIITLENANQMLHNDVAQLTAELETARKDNLALFAAGNDLQRLYSETQAERNALYEQITALQNQKEQELDEREMLNRMAARADFVVHVWMAVKPREWFCKLSSLTGGYIQCHSPSRQEAIAKTYLVWLEHRMWDRKEQTVL